MSEDSEDGWIDHDGKGMPVEASTVVKVKFRDGVFSFVDMEAREWGPDTISQRDFWVFGDDQPLADIIAYRVVKP